MGLSWNNDGPITLISGEALEADRLVKLSAGTAVYNDAGDEPLGVTTSPVASGVLVAIRPVNSPGATKVTASGVISAGAAIYAADDGKVSATVAGRRLGTILEATTANGGKAPAVLNVFAGTSVNYDMIFGQNLTGTDQDIDEASDTQNYTLGTRRITPEGDEYVYAKAGATINTDMAVSSYNSQHIAYTTVAASAAAAATSVTIDVAATDGVAGDGVIALNELKGGRIVFFPHSSNTFVRTITGNTAEAGGGGEITVTLNKPLPVALTVDVDHCEAMASPYLDTRTTNMSGTRPFLGAGTVAATVGQFYWIHKTGITWLAPQAEVGVGDSDNEVTFRHDGSLDEHDYSDAYNTKAQHAGYVMTRAAAGTQGAPFVMLRG